MTSLLATQLNRLRIPEGQAASADYRRRKSLIYTPLELGKVDAAGHFERAQRAFQHLLNVDPSLEEFRECFFSEERLNFEPSMQTPEQKAVLDQFIEHFYIRISQHLLLSVTLEALEWLVYRFQTHLYNMEFMLQAVLPYHSTNLFPKFLQLFDFNAQNKRWHWLKPLATNGVALTKLDLLDMAARDDSLLLFLCQLVQRAFKVFGPEESRLQLFVNLYAQVTLGILMKPLESARLARCVNCLNAYIIKGMRSPVACYRHAAYQIVQLLALRNQLSGTLLYTWIKRLVKSSSKYEPDDVCLLIASLCKSQNSQVPNELTEGFIALCHQARSPVLNDFPEIVERNTADVDILFDEKNPVNPEVDSAAVDEAKVEKAATGTDTADVDMDDSVQAPNEAEATAKAKTVEPTVRLSRRRRRTHNKRGNALDNKRGNVLDNKRGNALDNKRKKHIETVKLQKLQQEAATGLFNLLFASAARPDSASDDASASIRASPLLVVGSLVRLLASSAQLVRSKTLDVLRILLAKARPESANGGAEQDTTGGPSDESEEDAQIWDTAEAVLAEARSIEHDQHWVLRQQLAPACSRLVWMSIGELLDGFNCAADRQEALERRCLLGHLAFLTEAQLALCIGQQHAEAGVKQLLRMIRLPDFVVARAVALMVTHKVFNPLSGPLKLTYLLDGLGSITQLADDPDVVALASGYSIETNIYLDCFANLFGLVPTKASIQVLSAKRKTLTPGNNAYQDMDETSKRQTRLLFKLISGDGGNEQLLDGGLKLVIRLLEVLQILVQAYFREQSKLAVDAPAAGPTAFGDSPDEPLPSGVVSDIGMCLLATDRAAVRTPECDGKLSGLADLIPVQAVLDCARTVPDRRCQYAAVSLLCRLCRLAPGSAAACCPGLVAFLTQGGFFGRADRHSGELWHGLAGSVLPAFVKCNPSGIPLLVQLMGAYEDMPPSRRPEVFSQLISALGVRPHLWALVMLLNCRAGASPARRRRQQQRISESTFGPTADEAAADDAIKPPPIRRRRLSGSVSAMEDDATSREQPQFDSLGSSIMAAFPVPQQLLACAALLRHLLGRLDPEYTAKASPPQFASFAEMLLSDDHSGMDEVDANQLGEEDEIDDEEAALLLPADTPPADLAAQLCAGLGLTGAHLGRRNLLADMSRDASLGAMTQLLGVLVDVLLWSTSPQHQQQQRRLTALCVRTIERAETAVPGAYFLRVVNGLLARPEASVRRKALDLMLSKLTGLDVSCVSLLKRSLLDCLAGVERSCTDNQVALICGRELVRLLGQTEPKPVLKFCSTAAASCSLLTPVELADADSSSRGQSNWETFGCTLLVCSEAVKQIGIGALALVARVVPRLLPRLRVSPQPQPPPPVVLLAAYAFLQQCTVDMCDMMVPYLPELLPTTVDQMLNLTANESQLRPKLRAVLSSVARGVQPGQLLPVLQGCIAQQEQQQQHPWLRAELWARLLRLNLQTAASLEVESDDDDENGVAAATTSSLADYEVELSDLVSRLLETVSTDAADAAAGGSPDAEDGPADRAHGRLVEHLAACLAPLPPASRAILLQSLQDWATNSTGREAAFHRLLAAALHLEQPPIPGLAALICELDAPQHAVSLLDAIAGPPHNQNRRLLRWILACLAALFRVNCLSLDLLDSLGSLLVDRLVTAADAAVVTRRLLPCLTAYAEAAAADEALLKPLLKRLCERGCRCFESASVRHYSLLAIEALLEALGDVFIDSLAADCVPAIAELAEDDSEEVERLAQKLLAEIERRAGEPLAL